MKLVIALATCAILIGGAGTVVSSVGAASHAHPTGLTTSAPATARAVEDARPNETPWSTPPRHIWQSTLDVRAVTAREGELWAATGGGLERFRRAPGSVAFERTLFGVRDGLDTLDTRVVRFEGEQLVAETATARCAFARDTFTCEPRTARAPELPTKERFEGHAVTGRVQAFGGTAIATKGGGVFLSMPDGRDARRLTPPSHAPASFVHATATFKGALWLGTFRDGLVRVALERGELPADVDRASEAVVTPFRMVNELAVVDGVMFVASNEGLFSTRDGFWFEAVPAIGARAITGVAADERDLFVTSTGALYRMARDGKGKVRAAHLAPAGSKSIQGVAPDGRGGAWLATEDRGLVRFDGKVFVAMDRVSGLPTSWVVSVTSDGAGGALAATLRHGFLHVAADGTWARLDQGAGAWGLSVSRVGGRICSGAQEGAACRSGARTERLAELPDARVHHFDQVGNTLLVATEAGVAFYR